MTQLRLKKNLMEVLNYGPKGERVLASKEVNLQNVLNLTDPDFLNQLNLSHDFLISNDYTAQRYRGRLPSFTPCRGL